MANPIDDEVVATLAAISATASFIPLMKTVCPGAHLQSLAKNHTACRLGVHYGNNEKWVWNFLC